MNSLQFDFTVDKATKTVYVTREFDAGLDLVWDAFTKQEILDQWWAPKPWMSETKSMDFTVGGRRFYAMVSPDGQQKKLADTRLYFHKPENQLCICQRICRQRRKPPVAWFKLGSEFQ